MARSLVPPGSSDAVLKAVITRLTASPINESIVAPRVFITHVQNEAGEDMKMKLPEMSRDEAIAMVAKDYPGMDLVQQASNDGRAYCRVKREKQAIVALVAKMTQEAEESSSSQGGERRPTKHREQQVHAFRDAVDGHFISWKSDKVLKELEIGFPVRVSINNFVSPQTAVDKLREFMTALKKKAESASLIHHYTGFVISDREVGVTLQPIHAGDVKRQNAKVVRHPSDVEWDGALEKLIDACEKAGKAGTYYRNNANKKVNIGTRQFRVDKYGRRLD